MTLGYKASLGAIFAERNVPSEIRTVLNIIAVTYVLRIFLAPLADRYYNAWMGKRKTYLIPCKLFAFSVFSIFSLLIEDWVEGNRVITITAYFFVVNCVMIFESNALQGFRMDFFGRKNAGAASSAHTISNLIGFCIGL